MDLEKRPNWQATFLNVRTGHRECLMRTINGGYYWHSIDYSGLFYWGATSEFDACALASSLKRGILILQSGKIPAVMEGKR